MVELTSESWLTRVGTITARPTAFVVFGVFTVAWIIFQPDTLDWHGVATLVTWLMTLFIQRTEHRDTQAIQAKLDELLRAIGAADTNLSRIDDNEPESIEQFRKDKRT